MNASARARLARVAGTDAGENVSEPSAKTTTLNVSDGRRTLARSPISVFAVSSGKPYIDPDTSSTNTYSRGGTWSAWTACGGSATSRKKFSLPPWYNSRPEPISRPLSR
jgi:hypothetical protein